MCKLVARSVKPETGGEELLHPRRFQITSATVVYLATDILVKHDLTVIIGVFGRQ
jgi:hypothetical protein